MRNLPGIFNGQSSWDVLKRVLKSLFRDLVPREDLPTDDLQVGRFIIFKAAAGVYWLLLYTGEETLPWAKLGGPPLREAVETDQSTESTTYANLTTTGPSLTTPLRGDYDVHIEFNAYVNPAAANVAIMSYAIGATAANDADRAEAITTAFLGGTTGGGTRRKKSLEASVAIVAKYKMGAKAAGHFRLRRISLDPVRVG